eukprot:TRINITY_DN6084_c0_g1_i1.p2 TRINITY_DN6084_c0_g1~~TRINITY_DN6084_c0_g1_i1.p2  ORF type:complete len:75 (+),score=7.93 TRINITY_DN6084_c0_g1_i1:215-439(+)
MCVITDNTQSCTPNDANYGVAETIVLGPKDPVKTKTVKLLFNNNVAKVADFRIEYEAAPTSSTAVGLCRKRGSG